MRETGGSQITQVDSLFSFKLTQIGCRMSRLAMTITSCEHTCATLLSTRPQSTGGDNESGEPDDPGPATLGSTAPEDPRTGITSLGVVHLSTMGTELRNAKSKNGPPVTSPGRGSIPSTLMLSTPTSTSKATASTQVGAPFKRAAPLPSYAYGTGASYACIITNSHACVGASCSDLSFGVTRASSPSTSAS
jgi:hypothetical protein